MICRQGDDVLMHLNSNLIFIHYKCADRLHINTAISVYTYYILKQMLAMNPISIAFLTYAIKNCVIIIINIIMKTKLQRSI